MIINYFLYENHVLTYPKGIETPDKLANLTGALLARGYKEQDVTKIWGGNWLRVMKEVLGA